MDALLKCDPTLVDKHTVGKDAPRFHSAPLPFWQARLPVWSPEEYAVSGSATANSTEEVWTQLATFANNQQFSERYMLDAWPLFNVNRKDDEGHEQSFMSDSLLRVQVNAALAYGSRGLFYYCWGDGGLWNLTLPDQFSGKGEPTPNYYVAKAANADALVRVARERTVWHLPCTSPLHAP